MKALAGGVRALVAITTFALSGCNMVMTHAPMLRSNESTASPKLRPGVWSVEQPCRTESPSPLCGRPVNMLVVTKTNVRQLIAPGTPPNLRVSLDHPLPYVIGVGKPLLVQLRLDPLAPPGHAIPAQFTFAALAPIISDEKGEIVVAEAWPVECGPPPKPGDANYGLQDEQGQVTNHPLPGLKMDAFDCEPEGRSTIQRAAIASRAWFGGAFLLRWVKNDLPGAQATSPAGQSSDGQAPAPRGIASG